MKTQKQKKYKAAREREWAKFIRKDRDWDWAYILEVMIFKLKRTRRAILYHGLSVDNKKVAAQIKEVIDLLKRVVDDNYYHILNRPFTKKYGRCKMTTDKQGYCKFLYRGKELTEEQHEEHKQISEKAYQMQKDDLRKALDLINEHLFDWWD